MKFTYIVLATLIATVFFFTSCKKTNDLTTDAAAANTAVTYQLKAINPSTTLLQREAAGNLQWTAGTASVDMIKFEAKKGESEVEFKSKASQKIDLFSAAASIGNITLPAGTYNEVEFKIQLVKNSNDAALELAGVYTASSGNVPVVLSVAEPLELKAEKSNVVITSNTNYNELTSIDLSKITNGITPTMLNNALRKNGTIVISSSSNTALYSILISNLHKSHSSEFEHD